MGDTESETGHVHTIPVDPSLTPDEAWAEICNFGRRVTWTGLESWASVRCGGEECRNVVRHKFGAVQ